MTDARTGPAVIANSVVAGAPAGEVAALSLVLADFAADASITVVAQSIAPGQPGRWSVRYSVAVEKNRTPCLAIAASVVASETDTAMRAVKYSPHIRGVTRLPLRETHDESPALKDLEDHADFAKNVR